MRLTRPTTKDFDAWLLNVSDDELAYLSSVTAQAFVGMTTPDTEGLTQVITLILHFSAQPALIVEEITNLLVPFSICISLETLRRRGEVIKDGKYSIGPTDGGATFTVVRNDGAAQQ